LSARIESASTAAAAANQVGQAATVKVEKRPEMQVSIFVRAGDRFAGRPLSEEIVCRALVAGLSGATAIRGLQGFGESARIQPAGHAGFNGSERANVCRTSKAMALAPTAHSPGRQYRSRPLLVGSGAATVSLKLQHPSA
jgi:Uncharacterized ACR, COG1993